ncbi:ImmA/IrrE family metallo-endopeptidase [Nocardia acidivorans]|uniref:ImmA/IrrE family metallo-endopeptidase n=1 Tax=Nocardia acidivorans TaxID=404580 RepID=UPI001470DB88
MGRSWYIKEDHTILIDSKLPPEQQQFQAIHMLAHVHLGHGPDTPDLAQQEHDATGLATEWFLPPAKLARLLGTVSTNAAQIASYLGLSVWLLAAALSAVPREYWQQVRALTGLRLNWPDITPQAIPQCVLLDALPAGIGAPPDPLAHPRGFTPPRMGQPASGPPSLEIRRTGTRRTSSRPEQGPAAPAVA